MAVELAEKWVGERAGWTDYSMVCYTVGEWGKQNSAYLVSLTADVSDSEMVDELAVTTDF